MGRYELQQWHNCHMTMEGCLLLYLFLRQTARDVYCFLWVMALQSKAQGRNCPQALWPCEGRQAQH